MGFFSEGKIQYENEIKEYLNSEIEKSIKKIIRSHSLTLDYNEKKKVSYCVDVLVNIIAKNKLKPKEYNGRK